jgi:hypothetical protein
VIKYIMDVVLDEEKDPNVQSVPCDVEWSAI